MPVEMQPCRLRQFHQSAGGHGIDVGQPTNAICAKNTGSHLNLPALDLPKTSNLAIDAGLDAGLTNFETLFRLEANSSSCRHKMKSTGHRITKSRLSFPAIPRIFSSRSSIELIDSPVLSIVKLYFRQYLPVISMSASKACLGKITCDSGRVMAWPEQPSLTIYFTSLMLDPTPGFQPPKVTISVRGIGQILRAIR